MGKETARNDAYFARSNEVVAERERHGLMMQNFDASTQRRLLSLPVPLVGARVLEVAAGAGSVASWLAQQVGATGRVIATDLDTQHLEALGHAKLEIRQHDITASAPEIETFDIVHCRLLLMHLVGRVEQALAHMMTALRPGGWLLVEDLDTPTSQSLSVDHSGAAALSRLRLVAAASLRESGVFDPEMGRRLPELLAKAGLSEVEHEASTTLQRGGGPSAELSLQTYLLLESHLRGKVLDEKTWTIALATLQDPSYEFLAPLNFGAWGRKPQI